MSTLVILFSAFRKESQDKVILSISAKSSDAVGVRER